jgi:hypothetical protein
MPNSDDFDFDKVLDAAEQETLDQFAGRIAKLTKLTPDQIKEICPAKEDKAALEDLINIVNSKTAPNQQKAQLIQNAGKLGNVLLAVAKKFILPI